MRNLHWNVETTDLRTLAASVLHADVASPQMSARTAARCLSGIVNLVAQRWGVPVMQKACADLVRYEPAWSSSFGQLPNEGTGYVPEPVQLVAVVARGILTLAGADRMRAALSFWASENDPAVWTSVAGG